MTHEPSGLSFHLSYNKHGISIGFKKHSKKPSRNIFNILDRIEKLSIKYNKQIVLLFDGFQQLTVAENSQSIEGVIRQIAQATKRVSFIFTGSSRHLIEEMFFNRERPFYKMCDHISLNRIKEEEYVKYFETVAKYIWGFKLPNNIVEQILWYSECHPLSLKYAALSLKSSRRFFLQLT